MSAEKIETIMTGLGFTRYEARAYSALVREYPLTGYELSKRSGIPGSKIYECLERLNRKHLIVPVGDNPARYVAVPPSELVKKLSSDYDQSLKMLETLLGRDSQTDAVDFIFNINGYQEIIDKACGMTEQATDTLDLSLWGPEITEMKAEIKKAVKHGVKVRLLSFGGNVIDGVEHFSHKAIGENKMNGRWITVVADDSVSLTGQCSGDSIVAAWTKNRCIVFTSMKYIEHEIIKIQANL